MTTEYYNSRALKDFTVKLGKPTTFAITLVKRNKDDTRSQMWRFLVPFMDSEEQIANQFTIIQPYKRPSILDFSGRSPDQFKVSNILLTTPAQARSVQPSIDALKKCLVPAYTRDNSKRDDLDPPLLDMVWGQIIYTRMYMRELTIKVDRDSRLNGAPLTANVDITLISSLQQTERV